MRVDTDDAVLVGRKVGDSLWAVYASRDYVARHRQPTFIEEIQAHPVAAFEESMAGHRAIQWLHHVAPDANIVARSGSVLGLLLLVKAVSASRRCRRRSGNPSRSGSA